MSAEYDLRTPNCNLMLEMHLILKKHISTLKMSLTDIIGLMCLPPFNEDPKMYFSELRDLNKE
mgnify:CR=1 FL=1